MARTFVITGAGAGLGRALARRFAADGHRVVLLGRTPGKVEAAAAEIGENAIALPCDVSDPASVESAFSAIGERCGRIDVLINNAGSMVQRKPIAESTDALAREVLDVNFTSTVAMCRLVIPTMRQQGRGNIINVTSVAARHGGGTGAVLYAASKGAVSTFTRGLAKELAPYRIRVNALSPGVITTPFHERFTSQQQMDAMVATIPMGRAGTPEECVGAVFFLASDAMSGYVTGQIIEVNGGQFMP